MRTTTRSNWKFTLTISEVGRLIGKSPVTIRGWEAKHFIEAPRDSGGNRKFGTDDIGKLVNFAVGSGRISARRANLIRATLTLLEQIEYENDRKVKR